MCLTIFQNEKTTFQPIKTTSSKSRKIEIFPKGLTHGFGPKMTIIPTVCFQTIQAKKMCLTIFQNEKTTFQPIKVRSSKSRKIEILSKGLTHGFGQKMAIFPCFFKRKYRPGKCVLRYSRMKNRLFQPIKTRSLKTLKTEIFSKGLTHGFCKKWPFFHLFFL